jgi:surface protein
MEIKTLNEQIERLKALVRKCYATVAGKNGTVPEVGERNMENLPAAIASTHDTLEELTITQNGTYTPQEGVDGFSKVMANVVPTKRVMLRERIRVNSRMIVDGYWAAELIDTSLLTSIDNFFYNCSDLRICDVSNWDTSKVTNMSYAFSLCKTLEHIDVSNWDTSKVTSFTSIFYGCNALSELNTSNWVVIANDIRSMFYGCTNLESVDVSKFDTSKMTSLNTVFINCHNLKIIDVKNWDTKMITDLYSTFKECQSVKILDVSRWDVSNVTIMDSLFYKCLELEMLDLTMWDVLNLTGASYMFGICNKLISLIGNRTIEDVLENNICALNGLKVALSLYYTILDRASLRAVINGLADLTGQTSQTLTLGATLMAKLTEEDIAIAVNKNWNLA